ncbi:diguanylate cyclase [Massilia sp. PAMC28688]|nr:diguanylate cyclase [Massilia sp. PAMC28688]
MQGSLGAELLALAVANSGTGVWDRDVPGGRIVYSSAWKAMFGYGDDDISDRIEDSYLRVHPDDLAGVQATISAHFDNQVDNYAVEHRVLCKDGSYKWVISRGKVVSRDADGKPLRMTGVTTDISSTVALSEKLRDCADLLTRLTDEVPGLVYQFKMAPDGSAHYSYASAGIEAIFGITAQAASADASLVEGVIHPDDIDTYRSTLAHSRVGLERWRLQFRVILPDLGEGWREVEATPRRLDDGSTVWHGFVSDITPHKLLEQQLKDAAATDFLTGLPNRRHIMARMEQELARVQREAGATASVLMFDLDHFKAINDQHGHAVGDAVLCHFAAILQQELRRADSAGRIGGEEFALILSGADISDAFNFADRVRARLAETPLLVGATSLAVSVSVGLSAMRAWDRSVASALSRADAALYQAKESGRNQVKVGL